MRTTNTEIALELTALYRELVMTKINANMQNAHDSLIKEIDEQITATWAKLERLSHAGVL